MTEAEKTKKLCEFIKRQKAEILYWKDSLRMLGALYNARANEMERIITEHDNYVRSVAIKEFAERVIDIICEADDVNPVSEWQIRNLVKEMAGEDDGQAQQDRAKT